MNTWKDNKSTITAAIPGSLKYGLQRMVASASVQS